MRVQAFKRIIGGCLGPIALVLDTLMNRSFFTSLLETHNFCKETK